ncbi:Transposase type 1 [Trinorchestia longiramus]|nr:Transposase type 1 [Trinorchestia longiramus]
MQNNRVPFIDRIVPCDVKCILYDNQKRSGQWLNRDEAPKHFPKQKFHPQKITVTVWWCAIGVVHYSFLNVNQSIAAEVYCNQLDEMHTHLQKMWPALVNRRSPILLHDNARPHVARMTLQKLTDLRYETLPHSLHSPDLFPTDYYFFKHLDTFLSNETVRTKVEVESAFMNFLASKSQDFYRRGVNGLFNG